MAIGTPTTPILMVGGASATSFNTGDYTPPANCVLVAFVTARGASAEEPTISDTGATWTAITGSFADAGGMVGKLWELEIGVTAPTLNTTAGSVGATQTAIAVTDFPGGAVNQASIQVGTSGTGDPSVTMGAFGASSAGFGCAGISGGGTNTPPTGYTELNDSLPATNVRLHVCYDLTDPGTAIGWSGGGVSAYAAGLEIVEASVGGVTGTLAATEAGADTSALSGAVLVEGSLTATEAGSDAFVASGGVLVAGALAATETGSDTFAAAGTVTTPGGPVTGTLAAVEIGSDFTVIVGQQQQQGTSMAVPIIDVTPPGNGFGIPVTEAANGRGIRVVVAANGRGIPVVYTAGRGIPVVTIA